MEETLFKIIEVNTYAWLAVLFMEMMWCTNIAQFQSASRREISFPN